MIAMKPPAAGSDITEACDDAVRLAQRMRQPVSFAFNGVAVTVSPEDTAASARRRWQKDTEDRAEAYRNSPQGRAAAAEDEWDRQRHQRDVTTLIAELPDAIRNRDALMKWASAFALASDRVGVTWDKAVVLKILTDAGYKRNAHVGDAPDSFNNRQKMAEYIIGQVLECIAAGMGPHPITATFVEKYFALAE